MLRRIRRRTMAPGRPLVYAEQVGLLLLTVLALAGGIWFVAKVAFF